MSTKQDDEPSETEIAAFECVLEAENAFDADAVGRLYRDLPAWVPAPVRATIHQALATLRNGGQSPAGIVKLVESESADSYPIPGAAQDPIAFILAVNTLAHVKWALSLGSKKALKELAGDDAAAGHRMREQRGAFSAAGTEQKKVAAAQKRRRWLEIGKPLRSAHPRTSDRQLATWISRQCDDRAETIRAALKDLGLAKLK